MSKVIKSFPGFISIDRTPFVIKHESSQQDDEVDAISQTREQVESILRTAEAEAHAVVDQAYRDGYQAGMRDAMVKADELISEMENNITSFIKEKQEFADTVEPELLKLCLDIVEKIVRHEIKTDPRVVTRVIKSCLRRIKDGDTVSIRVSKQDVEYVRAQRDELLSVAESVRAINIIDDRRISPGGCVLESFSGDLDARIETQIEQIRKKLMETISNDCVNTASGSDEIQASGRQD